jgi:hypothetical protein
MRKKGVALTLIIFLACLIVVVVLLPQIKIWMLNLLPISEMESHIIILTYSQDGCKTIRLNETKQQWVKNWVSLAKSIGFKSIGVAELECYYLDDYLTDYLNLIREENLKASIYIYWRDFTLNVSIGHFIEDFWKPIQFPDNATKCSKWIEWIQNVTLITKDYDNIEFYLLFLPFRWAGAYQANFYNYSGYYFWMQQAVNAIKSIDNDTPVLLVSDGIELEDENLTEYIPYGLENIDGYGFTYYSRTMNYFNESIFNDYVKFYKQKLKQHFKDGGYLCLAEWGYQTNNTYVYGYCSGENKKSELIKQTLNAISYNQIKYWGYFAIQDFPSEQAEWGLAYFNYTLKPSGETMKELLKGE